MGRINLLDCTLRDGGYLNDWIFGKEATSDIIRKLEATNVEMLEVGFLRNEPYHEDRVVFQSMDQIKKLIGKKKEGIRYSVMGELLHPVPLEKIENSDESGIDIIRMILWKTKHLPSGEVVDALGEGYDYCKGLVEKGYKICIQPVRVSQYTDEEFIALVKRFSELNPLAVYVVDSWGMDNPEELLHYMHLADQYLPADIAIGYHGHNNMMHALSVAQDMLREQFEREIIIDASVYGIGRGAGNLNLELIAKYMNEMYGKSYDVFPMLDINEKYLQDIFKKEQWGYSIPFFLTAYNKCNPQYVGYLSNELKLDTDAIAFVLKQLSDEEKVIFSKAAANRCLEQYNKK